MFLSSVKELTGVVRAPNGGAADAGGAATEQDPTTVPQTEPGTETVEEPEAEPEGEPEPEEASPQDELMRAMQAFGIPSDPQGFASHMRELHAARQQKQQLEQLYWQSVQQQRVPPQEPVKQEAPKLPWDIPQFDESLKQFLTTDEAGNIVAIPGADPTLPAQYRKYQQAREQALSRFLSNPHEALQPMLMPLIQQEAQRIVQSQMQQTYQQQAIGNLASQTTQYWEAHKEEFEDPITGQYTPMGVLFQNEFRAAHQSGHPNPLAVASNAVDAELLKFVLSERAKEPAPKPQNDRLAFLKARNGNGRGGSMKRPNGKRSPGQSDDLDQMWENLRSAYNDLPAEDFKKEPVPRG